MLNEITEICECKDCGIRWEYDLDDYSKEICPDCFDENYGYCDECGKEMKYYNEMTEHNGIGIACKSCREKLLERQ